jgi:hypothetical protein
VRVNLTCTILPVCTPPAGGIDIPPFVVTKT